MQGKKGGAPRGRMEGAVALARRLGVTPQHLWCVRTGRRASRRVADALRAAGAAVEPPRAQ